MKTKAKLAALVTSLMLVFGILFAPTSNTNEAMARVDENSGICSLNYPGMEDPCTQAAVNCLCPIIITPDEN